MSQFNPTRVLSFDLETTSPQPTTTRIVTSALITIDGGPADKRELLADPGIEIPQEATAVHGITTEYAREHGQPHDVVLEETVRTINDAWSRGLSLVVYNAPFDLTVLHALTNGEFLINGPVFDPYLIDRAKDRYRKSKRTLGILCEHYGVPLDNAHEATADALASARIAWKMAKKWPELTTTDMNVLMEEQAVWYYDLQSDLKRYFESQGRSATDVNLQWPIQGL